MTEKEALERRNSEDCEGIYGFMYGNPVLHVGKYTDDGIEYHDRPDRLIFIKKNEIRLVEEDQTKEHGFLYRWGFPGPDWNFYKIKDYGRTWAFDPLEIKSIANDNPQCSTCSERFECFKKHWKEDEWNCHKVSQEWEGTD